MLGSEPTSKLDSIVRMSAWQGIYKMAWIEEHKLRFPSEREFISEDIIFHLDALPKAHSLRYLSDCLYYHIVDNPTSLTHKYNPERFTKCCTLYLEEKKRIEKLVDKKGMVERAQRMYLGNVRVCLKQIVHYGETRDKQFAMSEIGLLIKNDTLQEVLSIYPYYKNPLSQAIMSFMLRHKMTLLVYIFTKLHTKKSR